MEAAGYRDVGIDEYPQWVACESGICKISSNNNYGPGKGY